MSAEPDFAALAARIVNELLGWSPEHVERFATGAAHYVFDVSSPGRESVVARLGHPYRAAGLAEGARLMAELHALGVPLPGVIAHGSIDGFPYMLIERLPGTDLGNVVTELTDPQLRAIAENVAAAQTAAAKSPPGNRYGYAATPETAPHDRWSKELDSNFARSVQRLTAAALFDPAVLAPVGAAIERHRAELDTIPATPFLHDTTTRNVIVSPEGGFSGIVDVDDLCFGDPRYAPALTLAALTSMRGPKHYVDYWMDAAGHRNDHIFSLYVALFLLDLMSEHGHVFNGNEQPSTPEARAVLLDALTFETARLATWS
ncbi:aminoglycoside phosphotransferase family protein [Devosia sp. LjRoot16]|uniref:phosphotransferase family protein n=1 Tax=Devosia sp. LjRoot16 TaxID=3342271 RepID=UPI003ECFAFC6